MKKYYSIIAVLLIAMTFTGCSAIKNISKMQEENFKEQEENLKEEAEEVPSEAEPEEDFSPIHHAYEPRGVYAADSENIYFASNNIIYCVDRETDELSILAAILGGTRGELTFDATHVLYSDGNYLYYLQRYDAEEGQYSDVCSLWKIDKRNGDYQELSLPVTDGSLEEFFVANQVIYFKYWHMVEDETYGSSYEQFDTCYALTDDGDIGEEITGSPEDLYESLPDGYQDVYASYMGSFLYYPLQRTHFLKCILQNTDSYDFVLYIPKNAQIEYLFSGSCSICFFDGENLIYTDAEDVTCYKNVLTGETYQIAEDAYRLVAANEEEIYYSKMISEESQRVNAYEIYRLSFRDMREGGKGEFVLRQEQSHQIKNNLNIILNSFVTFAPGEIYYIDGEKDELDFIHYTTGDTEESNKNCGVLEVSRLKGVGEYISESDIFYCPDCNEVELEYYIESFHMQGGKAGDAVINAKLEENMTTSANDAIDTFTNENCEFHQDDGYLIGNYNYVDVSMNVSYVSDDYIGFLWNGYEYYRGAAHGMPYQYFQLFDRNTGEELYLEDILATSQEELNAIIYQRFSENYATYEEEIDMDYISQYGGYYADRQFQGGSYYLTQAGLVYYFSPYEVASYAMGMPSVVIPYEELDWKIDLWN